MRLHYALLLALCAVAIPCRADLTTYTQLCWQANATTYSDLSQDCASSPTGNNLDVSTPNPAGGPDQIFTGSASASATPDAFHLSGSLALSNYRQDNYVWTPYNNGFYSETTDFASVALTDGLTVTGGSGVYSLTYLFSLDGTLASSDLSVLSAQFCASLYIPTGMGTATGFCESAGQPGQSTFSLTYSDLPFGGPIDPTLSLFTAIDATTIYQSQVPTLGGNLLNGSASADFGSTIQLTSLTVTDSNGVPIPGITITSQDGYNYPVNPANSVPEPSLLAPLAIGLAAVALRRRFRDRLHVI